jgi:putative oxidoreductase
MNERQVGRTLVILGVAAVIVSMAWWASYFNLVFRGLGSNPPIMHPLGCLLFASDLCAQAKVTANVSNFSEYNSAALWASIAILVIGLVLVVRSPSNEPYPITPPGEPKLLIGKLEPFYAWVRELSWPLIRVAVAGTLFTHGFAKLATGAVAAYATASMARRGLEPALPLAYVVYFNEGIGTILVALGLFTRFAAASIAIEMFVLTFVGHFANGYNFTNPRGGWRCRCCGDLFSLQSRYAAVDLTRWIGYWAANYNSHSVSRGFRLGAIRKAHDHDEASRRSAAFAWPLGIRGSIHPRRISEADGVLAIRGERRQPWPALSRFHGDARARQ